MTEQTRLAFTPICGARLKLPGTRIDCICRLEPTHTHTLQPAAGIHQCGICTNRWTTQT